MYLYFSVCVSGKAGQMAADLDMEAAGGEGWGDDAELTMDEGEFTLKLTAWEKPHSAALYSSLHLSFF